MDIISIFENKLKTDEGASEEFAQKWDERAPMFFEAQLRGRKQLQEGVVTLLKEKGIISKEHTVLDIGAGAGRYTIPLAQEAKHVYGTDFSGKMVEYLNKVADQEKINNMTTRQLAWPTEEPVERVDVAFSAMCPCTRSTEALKQMSQVAKEYGVIAQMTKMSDDITDSLLKEGLIKHNPQDPHNNRELAQSYFNVLWELGFEPEVNFVVDSYSVSLEEAEVIEQYTNRYENLTSETMNSFIEPFLNDGKVTFTRTTRLAIINWPV